MPPFYTYTFQYRPHIIKMAVGKRILLFPYSNKLFGLGEMSRYLVVGGRKVHLFHLLFSQLAQTSLRKKLAYSVKLYLLLKIIGINHFLILM